MTNQEAFTKMVQHARRQGRKSDTTNGEYCLYRGENGLMCFVGAIIPDNEYRTEWDESGERVEQIQFQCPTLRSLRTDLLRKMQYTHDMVSPELWEERFERYAKEFKLSIPVEVPA